MKELDENITPANIGGMGDVSLPIGDDIGSGDIPKNNNNKNKNKNKMKVLRTFKQFVSESFTSVTESEVTNEAVNASGYKKAGKLGYNDQFLGRRSLSYTLSTDLGLDPKNEFGGGDWLGFDHVSLYTSGGKKGGTILDDALTDKYTYDELKAAAAKFLGL